MKNKIIKIVLPLLMLVTAIVAYIFFAIGLSNGNPNYILVPSLILFAFLTGKIIYLLISREKTSGWDIAEACINFVAVVPLLIAYVASIPNNSLREITSQFVAAIMGGLFTLAGVALTIKNTRLNRIEDDIKKARPMVFPIAEETAASLKISERKVEYAKWNTNFKKAKDSEKAYVLDDLYLANSDLAMCSFHGFCINNMILYSDYGQVIHREENVLLKQHVRFKCPNNITDVSLILLDMLGNEYLAKAEFVIETRGKDKAIRILSLFTAEIDKNFKDRLQKTEIKRSVRAKTMK